MVPELTELLSALLNHAGKLPIEVGFGYSKNVNFVCVGAEAYRGRFIAV